MPRILLLLALAVLPLGALSLAGCGNGLETAQAACDCAKGQDGESVWCAPCGVGYVAGERLCCRGSYEARREAAERLTDQAARVEAEAARGESCEGCPSKGTCGGSCGGTAAGTSPATDATTAPAKPAGEDGGTRLPQGACGGARRCGGEACGGPEGPDGGASCPEGGEGCGGCPKGGEGCDGCPKAGEAGDGSTGSAGCPKEGEGCGGCPKAGEGCGGCPKGAGPQSDGDGTSSEPD
jgi:hypothetical protein